MSSKETQRQEEIDEDYPGQQNDSRRLKIINHAVEAADRIIMEGSNGDTEETDYLTGIVAQRFMEKVAGRLQSELLKHDLHSRTLGKAKS